MGYAQTTIVVWGVELTNKQAEDIYKKYFSGGEMSYDKTDTTTNELSYVHRGQNIYRERYMPQMLADDADSRIHDMSYSEDSYRHAFGIYLASRGYAHTDKIENYLTPDKQALHNWDKYISPILKAEGINLEPSILLISQVW